jgi:tetratricopeptide (TPR) repeat protein
MSFFGEPNRRRRGNMSDVRFFWRAALLLGALPVPGIAQIGRSFTDRPVPGMRQMDRHNPFSPGYVDMTPGGFARRQAAGSTYGFRPGHSHNASAYYYGGMGYDFFAPEPYFDYGYFAPLPWLPPDPLLGLGPAMNAPGAAAPQAPLGPKPRPLNPEALARAGRFLSAGDEHFAAQRYRDANTRYRSATEAAPDLAEAFFRQGQALVAMGQYELAGKAFKRGMKLSDKWPQADFNLTELYAANQVAKTAHLEALAAAAGDNPRDATLLLLVGLQLYFDGQQERSRAFFRKAEPLLAGEALNLDAVK